MSVMPDEEAEELAAFTKVINAFRHYERDAYNANNRRRKDAFRIPLADRELLNKLGWHDKLAEVDRCIAANAVFVKDIVAQTRIFGEAGETIDAPSDGEYDEEDDEEEDDEEDDNGHREPHVHEHVSGHDHGHGGHGVHDHSGGHGLHEHSGDHGLHDHGHGDHGVHDHSSGHSHDRGGHSHDHGGSGGGRSHDHASHGSHSHDRGHSGHSHAAHDHGHTHGGAHNHSHSQSPTATNTQVSRSHRGPSPQSRPSEHDMDKVRSTIKQFVRDWSAEGKPERDQCYKPMLDALLERFKDVSEADRGDIRVLIPGAGLARLAYDVAHLGFTSQGNEFSHYMLLASHFILNRTSKINQHTIYPFIHSFSNLRSKADLLRAVTVPDVMPSDILGRDFSLVAGDFEEVYGSNADESEPQHGQWDAILTCFFMDTAKNVVNYLRIIHKILKPDGIWINLGPLLWHFENNTSSDVSIELDLEELKKVMDMVGFEITSQRSIDTTYAATMGGMLSYMYTAEFWTAKKQTE